MHSLNEHSLIVAFTVTATENIPDCGRLRQLLSYAAEQEGLSGELGVWLCLDEEIADLHLRFMDVPGATDVITFADDQSDGGYLGDIAVSVQAAAVQANDAGHPVEREVAYLCLHGLLHIAGFDDLDDHERTRMFERQDALLTAFEQEFAGDW